MTGSHIGLGDTAVAVASGESPTEGDEEASATAEPEASTPWPTQSFWLESGEAADLELTRPGHSTHHIRIADEGDVDFVVGLSISADVVVQGSSSALVGQPFGSVRYGDATTTTAIQWAAEDFQPSGSLHGVVGMRFDEVYIGIGTFIATTTGDPFSGASLHFGVRTRRLSRAVYFGGYGALRWAERAVVDGHDATSDVDLLLTEWQLAATFGIEIMFDLRTLITGRDGLIALAGAL